MGSLKIIKSNKNLFKLNDSNLNGVELTNLEDGSYKLNGTSLNSWVYRKGEPFIIKKGIYTISSLGIEKLTNAVFGIMNKDNSFKKEINVAATSTTFEIEKNMKVIPFFTCNVNTVYDNAIVKVQLEKSNVKTEFVKHEQKEYNLPIQKEMLKGDKFDLSNNKETHKFGYINTSEKTSLGVTKLDGTSEGFYRYSLWNIVTDKKVGEYIKIYCTHFKNVDSRWKENEGICGWENGQSFCVGTFNSELDTAEKMKNFLLNNNVEIYYELAEQEELDLTEEQKQVLNELNNLELFKGVNNIYTEQDLALLQLNYTADTKMYIDNKIASQNKEIINVAGGN